MKQVFLTAVLLFLSLADIPRADARQRVFAPMRYDVAERYGADNIYRERFRTSEGLYIIRLRSSFHPAEQPDLTELSINGETFLKLDRYVYPVIACYAMLTKENTLSVNVKDRKPRSGRLPVPVPKHVTVTVLPASPAFLQGAFGIRAWEALPDLVAAVRKMKARESAALAVASVDLRNDGGARADAVRKLADRKDPAARDFFGFVYGDVLAAPGIRAGAALGLGLLRDAFSIPVLLSGLLDPEEELRIGSARALALYPEDDTGQPLARLLARLDSMRREAMSRAIAAADWKPVGALMKTAKSSDPHAANAAVEMLGGIRNPGILDFLLVLLERPGRISRTVIIRALGKTGESSAADALRALAMDSLKRKGCEVELGMALTNLGDKRAADIIREMAITASTPSDHIALRDAYRRLTGNEL